MSNEYGIFQTIVEGEQADAYKKKKRDNERDRILQQRADTNKAVDRLNRKMEHIDDSNEDRLWNAAKKGRDVVSKGIGTKYKDHSDISKAKRDAAIATDAADRHMRRHPNSESTIEFI